MIQKIHKGRIAVYTEAHKLMEDRIYYTSAGMKRIMDAWMKVYPNGHYIQVRPYAEYCIKSAYRLDIIKDTAKIIRPAAVYSNSTSYKYT